MSRRHVLIGLICVVLMCALARGEETVNSAPDISNVRAAPRTDCSNLVDVYYELQDADGDECVVAGRC